jgi:hypothetical protein
MRYTKPVAKLEITAKNGTYALAGKLDEHASFAQIPRDVDPLRLDFSGIKTVNSVGIAAWVAFTDSWGTRRVEYHGCPGNVLDVLILVPATLGPERNTARLMSFQVVYTCTACRHAETAFVKTADLTRRGIELVFPEVSCKKCSAPAEVETAQAPDFLALVDAGALVVDRVQPQG